MTPIGICAKCGIRWLMSVVGRNRNTRCPECHGTIEPEDKVTLLTELFPHVP